MAASQYGTFPVQQGQFSIFLSERIVQCFHSCGINRSQFSRNTMHANLRLKDEIRSIWMSFCIDAALIEKVKRNSIVVINMPDAHVKSHISSDRLAKFIFLQRKISDQRNVCQEGKDRSAHPLVRTFFVARPCSTDVDNRNILCFIRNNNEREANRARLSFGI